MSFQDDLKTVLVDAGFSGTVADMLYQQLLESTSNTSGQLNDLMMAYFAIQGITSGTFNDRFKAHLEAQGATANTLQGMYAELVAQGNNPWSAGISQSEIAFWQMRAASLDPKAYLQTLQHDGNNDEFTWTVPTGSTWYGMNSFGVHHNTVTERVFLRPMRHNQFVPYPAGTQIKNGVGYTTNAFVRVFDPGRVFYTNPKDKYYERLLRLESLPIVTAEYTKASGFAKGSLSSHVLTIGDGDIFLVDYFCRDAAWTITSLLGTRGVTNLEQEVSDDHIQRFGGSMKVPFNIGAVTHFLTRVATIKGVATPFSSVANNTVLRYIVIPSDW